MTTVLRLFLVLVMTATAHAALAQSAGTLALPSGPGVNTAASVSAAVNAALAAKADVLSPVVDGLTVVAPNQSGNVSEAEFGPTTPTTGDAWTVPESLMLGGQQDMASFTETIRCLPYGPLDTGTCLSIVSSDRPLQGTRAGISPSGYAQTAAYANYDAVNLFNEATNPPPRLSICATCTVASTPTYTVGQVNFSVPLTTAQIALLRRNMHVMTNSVESSCPAQGNGPLPLCTYGGQITSWDPAGHWIKVDGWVVPGGGNSSGTQVPTTTYDTLKSNLGIPALFVGVYTKAFARNSICSLDPTLLPGDVNNPLGNVNSQVTQCTGEEMDLWNYATTPYYESLNGITVVYSAINGQPPTGDSFDAWLSCGVGDASAMPTCFRMTGVAPTGVLIDGDQFFVNGTASPPNTAGAQHLMQDDRSDIDGIQMHLHSYLSRDTTSGATIYQTSLHYGMSIGSTIGHLDGTHQGELVFNRQGYYSGASLVGYNGTGLNVDANGDATVDGSFTAKGTSFFNGTLQVGNAGSVQALNMDGPAGYIRPIWWETAGSLRWQAGANSTAEGGSNAGSDFDIDAYNDSGAATFAPAVRITRSNGAFTAYNAVNFPGGTVTIGTGSSVQALAMNGPATYIRPIWWETAGTLRWQAGANSTAEGGSNAGSDFDIDAYNDAGSATFAPAVRITRSSGLMTAYFGVSVPGGSLTMGTNASVQSIISNGPAAFLRPIYFETAGLTRWGMGANSTAEGGSNAGSDFDIYSYSDAGASLVAPVLRLTRSNGNALFGAAVTANGEITANLASGTGLNVVANALIGGTAQVTGDVTLNGTGTALTLNYGALRVNAVGLTTGTGGSVAPITLDGPSGYNKPIQFQDVEVTRWIVQEASTAAFQIQAYNSGGTLLQTALAIDNPTGNITTVGHLLENNSGSAPAVSSCGSGSAAVSGSSDMRFLIDIGASTSACTITASASFSTSAMALPTCTFTIEGQNAYAYIASKTSTTINLAFSASLAAGAYVHGICRG